MTNALDCTKYGENLLFADAALKVQIGRKKQSRTAVAFFDRNHVCSELKTLTKTSVEKL